LVRAKACLHVQDIELEAAFKLRILPKSNLFQLVERLHDRLVRSFDFSSTISAEMARRLARGTTTRRPDPVICRNCVDVRQIRPSDRENDLRTSLGLGVSQLVALFAGNMGQKQGLEALVDVARRLRGEPRVVFVLAGDGVMRDRLIAMADDLPNVIFLPLQPEERRNELLSLADLHILPQPPNTSTYAMPSKLAGMLASGRPIVAMSDAGSGMASMLTTCGVVVLPGDVAAMTAAVSRLLGEPELRHKLGKAARTLACKCFDSEIILGQYQAAIEAMLTDEVPVGDAAGSPEISQDSAGL
jgi:colanic acid biosynthesis glycosyl transferase WcaI